MDSSTVTDVPPWCGMVMVGSFVCGGTESVEQEQTVLSALFCCDSKTAQNIVY